MKLSRVFLVLFIFVFLGGFCVGAEEKRNLNVRIEQIISRDYPEMTAYTVIKNDRGELVSGLAPGLFSYRIDTAEIKAKSKIVPFSMSDEGVDYTIMISNNGIMEGEPFDFQKNALLKFVELMSDRDTLSIYTIGEDAGEVVLDVTNKTFDSAVINKIELSEGQPRLYDSIMNLIRKVEQKKAKRKVIVIISDGRDQNSRFSKDQLVETLSNSGLPVYTVGMKVLSNQSLSNLDEISQLTGGAYYYSSRFKDIPDNLKKVVDCVKQTYIVKLKVKNVKADNQAHLLEIKVEETESRGMFKNKNELEKMIHDEPQLKTAFFNASDLINFYELKFLLPNFTVVLTLWLLKDDFFLVCIIFNNSKLEKLFGIPMISALDEIEKNFQDCLIFKQIKRFGISKVATFVYDFNHDGTDEVLYLGISNMTGYTHFIVSGISINLEKNEMLNIRQFPNFLIYPEFINYKVRQGIKFFTGEEWQFYYYDKIQQKYVQDETATSEELAQIHGSPDFFAEAGIDYTKLERPLLPADLEGFSKPALRIWRNAIYARHGRTFKSEDLQALFNEYVWYKPDEAYTDDKLSDIDRANLELIQKFER